MHSHRNATTCIIILTQPQTPHIHTHSHLKFCNHSGVDKSGLIFFAGCASLGAAGRAGDG